MILSIVIPALNEEESIASIIERTHAASPEIIQKTQVNEVEIIVVSDGSTDKTVEIAQQYLSKIKLIIFEKNRGYGAAIKQGWEESKGDLLAFLDADGTCDPLFFVNLCNLLEKNGADVVLGCRLNKESKMPLIRRVGNFMFATLLTYLSSAKVKDTASGMRVVKKSSLEKLYPLPDGLHFTPAMSAKALMNENVVICEENMSYDEREGESKLHVLKDGIRFLKVIFTATFLYRPQIIFNTIASVFLLFSLSIMFEPIGHYLSQKRVEEWMIYRFITAESLSIFAFFMFCSSFILHNTIWLSMSNDIKNDKTKGIIYSFFNSKFSTFVAIGSILFGIAMVWESLSTRIATGETHEHWSRYIGFSFFTLTGSIILITKWINWVLGLVKDKLEYTQSKRK
jgi:glycosyltransferase involved in cell wall biosynthesis